MSVFICRTCAVEQRDTAEPPSVCAICTDERQYVRPTGQRWTTLEELAAAGRHGTTAEVEPGLHGISIEPSVGIGQRALLIQTPSGNVLWDPNGYLDDERVTLEMMDGFDAGLLLCSHARLVSDRGVHVCPILLEAPDALLALTLGEALRPYALRHHACYTCYQYGSICANPSGGPHDA